MIDNNRSDYQRPDHSDKTTLASHVLGTVKWFNVKSGYGFINRMDTKEDIFVHQSAIIRNNPDKIQRSLADSEEVEFDVVKGEKGTEAVNVTGPHGQAVHGSKYATDKRRFAPRVVGRSGDGRYYYRIGGNQRRNYSPRNHGYGSDDISEAAGPDGDALYRMTSMSPHMQMNDESMHIRRRGRGGIRGGRGRMPRERNMYPPRIVQPFDENRGPPRMRGGRSLINPDRPIMRPPPFQRRRRLSNSFNGRSPRRYGGPNLGYDREREFMDISPYQGAYNIHPNNIGRSRRPIMDFPMGGRGFYRGGNPRFSDRRRTDGDNFNGYRRQPQRRYNSNKGNNNRRYSRGNNRKSEPGKRNSESVSSVASEGDKHNEEGVRVTVDEERYANKDGNSAPAINDGAESAPIENENSTTTIPATEE